MVCGGEKSIVKSFLGTSTVAEVSEKVTHSTYLLCTLIL